MTTNDEPFNKSLKSEELSIPQYRLPIILFMYAWPVAWFMLLIYVIGPAFVQSDRTYPLWAYNLIGVLVTAPNCSSRSSSFGGRGIA
jgi:hypothetical protein